MKSAALPTLAAARAFGANSSPTHLVATLAAALRAQLASERAAGHINATATARRLEAVEANPSAALAALLNTERPSLPLRRRVIIGA